jgi:hypothetical protein
MSAAQASDDDFGDGTFPATTAIVPLPAHSSIVRPQTIREFSNESLMEAFEPGGESRSFVRSAGQSSATPRPPHTRNDAR